MNHDALAEAIKFQADELHWREKAVKLARRLRDNKPKSPNVISRCQADLQDARAHRAWAEGKLRAARRLL